MIMIGNHGTNLYKKNFPSIFSRNYFIASYNLKECSFRDLDKIGNDLKNIA